MHRSVPKLTAVLQTALTVVAVAGAALLLVPRLLGWQVDTVLSGSMTPAYPVGSVLFVKPVSPPTVEVGDVITFRTGARDGTPVSHRVVSVDHSSGELSFVTKGDANEDADPTPVGASALQGRVAFGVPLLGRFVRAVRTPVGFSLLLFVFGLTLMAGPFSHLARTRRRSAPLAEGSAS